MASNLMLWQIYRHRNGLLHIERRKVAGERESKTHKRKRERRGRERKKER